MVISPKFLKKLDKASQSISASRKEELDRLFLELQSEIEKHKKVTVKFICTHNSRRSQLAEFMLDVLAREKNIKIRALSAGTESTAFAKPMVKAIMNEGFELLKYGYEPNPLYIYRMKEQDLFYFSKKYDEEIINFGNCIVVTVCGDADENCPFIPGTKKRLHLGYKDPKFSDGTPQENQVYTDKVLEIGSEMYYLASKF